MAKTPSKPRKRRAPTLARREALRDAALSDKIASPPIADAAAGPAAGGGGPWQERRFRAPGAKRRVDGAGQRQGGRGGARAKIRRRRQRGHRRSTARDDDVPGESRRLLHVRADARDAGANRAVRAIHAVVGAHDAAAWRRGVPAGGRDAARRQALRRPVVARKSAVRLTQGSLSDDVELVGDVDQQSRRPGRRRAPARRFR